VHAFATDPERGVFVLAFLALVVGSSLVLYAWRAPSVGLGGRFELLSRETLLLVNNVLLAVAAAAVLLGTLYPLLLDAVSGNKISVGAPYFDAVFFPLMIPVVLLMGIGPFARWKQARLIDFWPRLAWAVIAAVVLAAALPFLLGRWSPLIALGLLLGFWAVFSSAAQIVSRLKERGGDASLGQRLAVIPRATWGMVLAHVGIGVFIFGVTLVKGYETAADVKMGPGDTTTAGGYSFKFVSVENVRGPNYTAARAKMEVSRDGKLLTVMEPEKRMYMVQRMPMTEAAIETGLFRDLYVSMGEPVDDTTWIVRVQHKPLVAWIWGGCVLMALGGLLAASDRRYRLKNRKAAAPVGTTVTV
jgi:cytochrome c-type biogenesis protein CcmF